MCGGFNQCIGEVVVGVVQFGLFLAGADAEHGTGEDLQIVGKVFGPAERGEQVAVAAVAVLLDVFDYVGAVFGGREGVAQGVGDIQLVLCGDAGDDAVGLGQQLLHDGVGESTECEHDVGLAGRGAEGFLAQLHADECALAEVVEVGLVVVVEPVEGLNDFGGSESGVDAFLGGGGMGAAAFEISRRQVNKVI